MFIRFVSAEIDPDSHVSAGLFIAAHNLLENGILSDPECYALNDSLKWFDEHLRDPFRYRLKAAWRAGRAICWFKSTAHWHLSRAWEVAAILERNSVFIRLIKAERVGYILYEDEAQILAQPFAEIRRLI